MKPNPRTSKLLSLLNLLCAVGLSSAQTHAAQTGNTSPSTQWSLRMRGLEQTYQELLTDLVSDERFNAPKNFKRIEKNAEKFAQLAQELNSQKAPDADPSLPMIANQFSQEAERAYKTLKWGHRAYARDSLRSMTSYCMACHTRNSSGPQFQVSSAFPSFQSLNSRERADFYASTRQFNRALEEYEKIVSDASYAKTKPFDWESSIRSGLAIAVRVNPDPARALSIVERVLTSPHAPYYLKEQAAQWKQSLQAWKNEPPVKFQSDEDYHSLAIRLVAEARALQKYPTDRSADILYLRASSAAHDLLSIAPKGAWVTDGLYLAGLSYEVLQGLNLWDQHEIYYLACVKSAPHTEKSRQCFKHYEQSIYLGYTGTGGTDLPTEVREDLRKLEQLSLPTAEPKSPQQKL